MIRKLALLSLTAFFFTHSFGQLKLEDLKVDTTITGFHFAIDSQGMNFFTKDGTPTFLTLYPTAFSFIILPGVTAPTAKSQFAKVVAMSKENGNKVTGLIEKDTTLKGNTAYYISYTETDDETNYKNIVFNAFVIKDNTLILFKSDDLDKGKFTDKFKQTFFSIKL